MVVKRQVREEARQLRQQGLSIKEIAVRIGVSRDSISQWVRDIELTEEQQSELHKHNAHWAAQNAGAQANREKSRQKRFAAQEMGRSKAKEGRPMHLIGCMLYWAEGAKRANGIYFVNSDQNMLLLFMRFLREEMGVDSSVVSLIVHCHTYDADEKNRIKLYWLNLLNLPSTCHVTVLTKKGSDSRRNRLENGLCGIRVFRTELVQHIYGAIQEYGSFDNPNWLF